MVSIIAVLEYRIYRASRLIQDLRVIAVRRRSLQAIYVSHLREELQSCLRLSEELNAQPKDRVGKEELDHLELKQRVTSCANKLTSFLEVIDSDLSAKSAFQQLDPVLDECRQVLDVISVYWLTLEHIDVASEVGQKRVYYDQVLSGSVWKKPGNKQEAHLCFKTQSDLLFLRMVAEAENNARVLTEVEKIGLKVFH